MRILFTAILLVVMAASAVVSGVEYLTNPRQYDDAPGFVGYVQNRFIVVLKDGVAIDHAKDAGSPLALSELQGFADLAQRFSVSKLGPQFPGSDRRAMAQAEGAGELARHYRVYFDSGQLEEVMAAYEANPLVERVEPIGIHTLYATPNDPYYDDPPPEFPYDQWHYWDTYGVNADSAWDKETGSQTVIVGDLDIGIKYDHGDLGGSNPPGPDDASTNGNIWVNTGETPGNSTDDDGNGYVDDVIGWDFVESGDWYPSYPCIDLDCGGADNDPWDGDGHGTHTCGTIAAITHNGYAVAGVAGGYGDGTFAGGGNGVKVVPCRIGYVLNYFGQALGVVIMDYVAEAMYYMADLKTSGWNVAAINCSFGSSNTGGLGAACTYLQNQDVIVVVAAGNSNSSSPDYLGSRGDCLDVGGTQQNGNPYASSNYGPWVEIAAPAVDVLSTVTDPDNPTVDYISLMTGTSMACPHVVGVVALLESYKPSLTAAEKFAIITDVNNTRPYNMTKYVGVGIVDARKCLDAAQTCDLVADFSGSPTSGCASLTVDFTDLSTGTGIDGWDWDFGDGVGTSTAQNPSYTYDSPGTYTVTLTVSSSSQGCDDTEIKTDYITVNGGPTADFVGDPLSGTEPLTVDFTDLSTDATGWDWDFGDGVGTSTQQNPSYTYDTAGTYTVTLTATNACGSDVEQKVDYITVNPCVAPTADFSGSPTTGDAPLTVDFTDLSSGNPTSWDWDFGDNGSSAAQNPSHTYNDTGYFTVTLTATNACGSDVETKVDYIHVTEPQGPDKAFATADIPVSGTVTGDFTYTHTSDDSYEVITEELYTGHPRKRYSFAEHKWTFTVGGSSVTFYVEAYRPTNGDGDDFIFEYSTDDVNYYSLVTVASATEQTYSAGMPDMNGTVYVRVYDSNRSWGNNSLDPVYVDYMYIEYSSQPGPPVADFVGDPTSGTAPLTVQFTDQSTGDPTSWSWDFGDGVGTSTDQDPQYTYPNAGTYTVSLTATNAYGSDTKTETDYITVSDPGQTMHVHDMTVSRKTAGPNCSGQCWVTIYDSYSQPVANATVYTVATGPVSGSYSAVTDASGVAFLETGKTKNCSGEWCFEVTDVTHATLNYNSADNNVTKACESGWVYGEGSEPFALNQPNTFGLSQNYPNPFNPTTQITFYLDQAGYTTLEVYNVVGRKVSTLVDRYMNEGEHTVSWDGLGYSSGIYLYRLTSGHRVVTRKMILLK